MEQVISMAEYKPQVIVPQFTVKTVDGVIGSTVSFNGQLVRNVRSVDVSTTISVDDVVRSRITIELVGEPIPVDHQA